MAMLVLNGVERVGAQRIQVGAGLGAFGSRQSGREVSGELAG